MTIINEDIEGLVADDLCLLFLYVCPCHQRVNFVCETSSKPNNSLIDLPPASLRAELSGWRQLTATSLSKHSQVKEAAMNRQSKSLYGKCALIYANVYLVFVSS